MSEYWRDVYNSWVAVANSLPDASECNDADALVKAYDSVRPTLGYETIGIANRAWTEP